MAFRSEFDQKVDTKARVMIPAPFRAVIQSGDPDHAPGKRPRFVIVYGGDNRHYLECYTMEGMRKLEARIGRMKLGDKRRIYLSKNLVRMSIEVEIDNEGRIVMPGKCREKLGFGGDALEKSGPVDTVFAGDIQTFQIWTRAEYDADRAGTADLGSELLPDGEDMLSLLDDDDTED